MAGRFVLRELASATARSAGRLGAGGGGEVVVAGIGTLSKLYRGAAVRPGMVVPSNHEILRGYAGGGIGTLSKLFRGAAVRPGMVVPSNHETLRGCAGGGIGTLSNLFCGAAVRPGMVVPSNREIHSTAAKCTGRSRSGRLSSSTNHKDLLHEQNMKIIKLQNEIEIAKADMEVLRADMKLEVVKGQSVMLKYCIFIVGAGLVGSVLVEPFAS